MEPRNYNAPIASGYGQVCVLHGVEIPPEHSKNYLQFFEDFFKTNFGRSDIFFALHDDDVTGFTITRLSIGARWIEDVLSEMNGNRHLYPSRVQNYCLWDA